MLVELGSGLANYSNDCHSDYSSEHSRFPNLQGNGGNYEEEIYFRTISRSRNDITSNDDNSKDFQNQIIMNNFVTNEDNFGRRPSNISFDQDQDKQLRHQMLQGYRKQHLFPKLF